MTKKCGCSHYEVCYCDGKPQEPPSPKPTFDLERAKKDGARFVWDDNLGYEPVRIIATDRKDLAIPIVFLYGKNSEGVGFAAVDGRCSSPSGWLVNVPRTVKVWTVVRKSQDIAHRDRLVVESTMSETVRDLWRMRYNLIAEWENEATLV